MAAQDRGWTTSRCSRLGDQGQSNHWCDTTFSRLTLVIEESTGPVLNERADYNYVFLTFVEPVWKMPFAAVAPLPDLSVLSLSPPVDPNAITAIDSGGGGNRRAPLGFPFVGADNEPTAT
jgi:hypothetical protein